MSRTVKTLAVVLLLAVMPLRAIAAVTIGFCASGHHDSAPVVHEHEGQHDHGQAPEPAGGPDCSVCAEHCSSASFAVPAPADALFAQNRSGRIALDEAFAAGFVPDHLDPPPLAL